VDDKNDYSLLASLSRLTGRSEDFVTDSFVHLLRRLAIEQPKFLNYLLKKISGTKRSFKVKPQNIITREFEEISKGRAYPDIKIDDDENHLIIEVKVEASIDSGQLKKYKKILNSKNKAQHLAMIIGYRDEKKPIRNVKINRWYDIASELENGNFRGSQVTNYLIEEFLELLRYNEVSPYPGSGDISKEISAIRKKVSRNPSLMKDCILYQKHSSNILSKQKDKFEYLPNLYAFLSTLEESIREALSQKKVPFALLAKKMMGFSSLKFGFWIEYYDPDVLALSFYNHPIGVPKKLKDKIKPKDNEGFELEDGKYRFYRLIDLYESNFYNFNEEKKTNFLKKEIIRFENFCKDNFI
jgi:hypothetical protein